MIYVFGNSHANVFTRSTPEVVEGSSTYFKSYAYRPFFAAKLIRTYSEAMMNFTKQMNKETDYLLIPVGEADCRSEIRKLTAYSHEPMRDILRSYIDNFFEDMLWLKSNGYRLIGWGGHPTINVLISQEWEAYMEHKCNEHSIPFVSILNELIVPDTGLLDRRYYSDDLHLNSERTYPLIENKMRSLGLIKD